MSSFTQVSSLFATFSSLLPSLRSRYSSVVSCSDPTQSPDWAEMVKEIREQSANAQSIDQNCAKFEVKALEKDPEKRIWGDSQSKRALELVAKWKEIKEETIQFFQVAKQEIEQFEARKEQLEQERKEREAAELRAAERLRAEEAERHRIEAIRQEEEKKQREAEELRIQEERIKQRAEEVRKAREADAERDRLARAAALNLARAEMQAEQEKKAKEAEDKIRQAEEARMQEILKLPVHERSKAWIEFRLHQLARQSEAGAQAAMQGIMQIISNIINNPHSEEARAVNTANPILQQRVFKYSSALELFKVLGFEGPGPDDKMRLTPSADKWNALVLAKQTIELKLKEAMKGNPNEVKTNVVTQTPNNSQSAPAANPTQATAPAASLFSQLPQIMNNPLFSGLGGLGSSAGTGSSDPIGSMMSMMNNPQLQSLLADPQLVDSMMSSPAMRQMFGNPAAAASSPFSFPNLDLSQLMQQFGMPNTNQNANANNNQAPAPAPAPAQPQPQSQSDAPAPSSSSPDVVLESEEELLARALQMSPSQPPNDQSKQTEKK